MGFEVEILRYNINDGSYISSYYVPIERPATVQELVRYINYNIDETLAFRDYNCYQGVCACCVLELNEKPVRACAAIISPGKKVLLGPLKNKRIIKDLVTEL